MVRVRSADDVCAVMVARVQRYSDLAATFGYETLDRVSDAMETALRRALRMQYQGRVREISEFVYADQRIWGATAAMLLNLIQRMESVQ